MNNRNLIPTSALVTMGVIILSNLQDKQKEKLDGGPDELISTRELVGFLVLFTMLSAGADLGVPIAGGFAVLVMITILLARGDKALAFVISKTEKESKGKKRNKFKPEPESGIEEENGSYL